MDFDFVRATVLALVQGLTEFLPISSSAHLILPAALLDWEDQGLAFDVAVHLGTLLAVVSYFRRDLLRLFLAWLASFGGARNADARLAWLLILATLPAVVAGLLLQDVVQEHLRSIRVIAVTTILFGLVIMLADLRSKGTRGLPQLGWKSALFIGLAQAFALVPGTSRSGVTMAAGLFCNLDRESASRFSFLMAVPAISGASLLLGLELLQAPAVNWLELGYSLLLSALVAFLCIHYFLKVISAIGFLPFVLYRIILGVVLFVFFTPIT